MFDARHTDVALFTRFGSQGNRRMWIWHVVGALGNWNFVLIYILFWFRRRSTVPVFALCAFHVCDALSLAQTIKKSKTILCKCELNETATESPYSDKEMSPCDQEATPTTHQILEQLMHPWFRLKVVQRMPPGESVAAIARYLYFNLLNCDCAYERGPDESSLE